MPRPSLVRLRRWMSADLWWRVVFTGWALPLPLLYGADATGIGWWVSSGPAVWLITLLIADVQREESARQHFAAGYLVGRLDQQVAATHPERFNETREPAGD